MKNSLIFNEHKAWWYGKISREKAVEILENGLKIHDKSPWLE